uniref:Uncharacterized protein n=1 Tax=uncultured marine virus TaxID=186617 RepID=A0A0F7L9N9_9VIRU|nr:hypothetical protein [uncultured marine virus]
MFLIQTSFTTANETVRMVAPAASNCEREVRSKFSNAAAVMSRLSLKISSACDTAVPEAHPRAVSNSCSAFCVPMSRVSDRVAETFTAMVVERLMAIRGSSRQQGR